MARFSPALPARRSRDGNACGEVANGLRPSAVRVEHRKGTPTIGRVVACLGVRDDDLGFSVEETRDVVHLEARRARPVDHEDSPLLRVGELVQDVQRLHKIQELQDAGVNPAGIKMILDLSERVGELEAELEELRQKVASQ